MKIKFITCIFSGITCTGDYYIYLVNFIGNYNNLESNFGTLASFSRSFLKPAVLAILNVTAMAAILLIWGPPVPQKKTSSFISLAFSLSVVKITAPRGPQRVLWVVKVMTSASKSYPVSRSTSERFALG